MPEQKCVVCEMPYVGEGETCSPACEIVLAERREDEKASEQTKRRPLAKRRPPIKRPKDKQ